MATIEFGDFDAYQKALESLYKDTEGIVKQAVYKGAGIVADAIRQNLEALPIQEGKNGLPPIGTPENPLTGVSRRQKGDLINALALRRSKRTATTSRQSPVWMDTGASRQKNIQMECRTRC